LKKAEENQNFLQESITGVAGVGGQELSYKILGYVEYVSVKWHLKEKSLV
jgi:hypothetical protein